MSDQPILDERVKGHKGYGLIQVVTGDGKGKTTSAIGSVVRTIGAGKKAVFLYFDKGGEHYMERKVFDALAVADYERGLGRVEWFAFGRDRIDPKSGRFDFFVTDEDRALGHNALAKIRELFAVDDLDLLVLDEVNSSCALGFVDEAEVLKLLDQKPDRLELILTGRNAPESFKQKAHLVSEVVLRKHYFYSGVKAREGIDF